MLLSCIKSKTKRRFTNHIIISDIASGLNFKRKGLIDIINMAIKNSYII